MEATVPPTVSKQGAWATSKSPKGHDMKIHEIALNKAISILQSLNCQFAIIDAQGNKHGKLLIAESKPAKLRKMRLPFREVTNFCAEHLTNLQVGAVAQLPIKKYGSKNVQSWSSSFMQKTYGKGSYTSHINRETEVVEILRIF